LAYHASKFGTFGKKIEEGEMSTLLDVARLA